MTKLLLTITFLLTTIFASEAKMQSRELPTRDMKSQNTTIAKLAATEMSKSLPHKVDKVTTLMIIKSNGASLEYIYEIDISPKSDKTVQEEDHSRMEKAIIKGTCKSSKRFLEADISLIYIYNSATTKDELFRFNVNQESCFKL